LALCLSNAKT